MVVLWLVMVVVMAVLQVLLLLPLLLLLLLLLLPPVLALIFVRACFCVPGTDARCGCSLVRRVQLQNNNENVGCGRPLGSEHGAAATPTLSGLVDRRVSLGDFIRHAGRVLRMQPAHAADIFNATALSQMDFHSSHDDDVDRPADRRHHSHHRHHHHHHHDHRHHHHPRHHDHHDDHRSNGSGSAGVGGVVAAATAAAVAAAAAAAAADSSTAATTTPAVSLAAAEFLPRAAEERRCSLRALVFLLTDLLTNSDDCARVRFELMDQDGSGKLRCVVRFARRKHLLRLLELLALALAIVCGRRHRWCCCCT